MKKFEYLSVEIDIAHVVYRHNENHRWTLMNELGEDGWELITTARVAQVRFIENERRVRDSVMIGLFKKETE